MRYSNRVTLINALFDRSPSIINSTLSCGEFSKSLANEREAVGTYFVSGFIDQ